MILQCQEQQPFGRNWLKDARKRLGKRGNDNHLKNEVSLESSTRPWKGISEYQSASTAKKQ